MSDARKRAEEALAKWDSPVARQLHEKHSDAVDCVLALRALLADAPPADAATEAVMEAAEYIARCAGCGSSDCTAMAGCTGFPSSSRENLIDSCVEDTVRARRILALSTPAPAPSAKEGRE